MKTRYFLLFTVLTIALTLPMYGWYNPADTSKTDVGRADLLRLMGKPTVDTTVGGVQMKVWLMTQDQHKEMMREKVGQMPTPGKQEGEMRKMEGKGLNHTSAVMVREMKALQPDNMARKDTSMSTDTDTVDAIQASRSMTKPMEDLMIAGTHHIALDVTERASEKDIAGISGRVLIESPSKKSSAVELKSAMGHFGGDLRLDEKGEYRFTISVSFGGNTRTAQFQYALK